MPPQVALSRICFRCRMHIFTNGFRLISSSRHVRTNLSISSWKQWVGGPVIGYRKFSTETTTLENNKAEALPREGPILSESEASTAENPSPAESPLTDQKSSKISSASKFLASQEPLESGANGRMEGQRPIDYQAREKKMLKSYRVLLRDTKVDVDLDEVMKVATTIPPPPLVFEREKPTKPSKALPVHLLDSESKFSFPAATHQVLNIDESLLGKEVVLHGYFDYAKKTGRSLIHSKFYDHYSNPIRSIVVVSWIGSSAPPVTMAAHQILESLRPFTPVAIRAEVQEHPKPSKSPKSPKSPDNSDSFRSSRPHKPKTGHEPQHKPEHQLEVELLLKEIIPLNSVTENLIYTKDTVFPPEKRHLQLRTTEKLYSALRLRSLTASVCRGFLENEGFLEVETPLLFKSTPEGAREFLVPTRGGNGICYALPQSPQQYKQMLMASGVPRYYQIAKCFRDEDLRADRQPEFTQLDLEMSFAAPNDVMGLVERLVVEIWREVLGVRIDPGFRKLPYLWAMRNYGTDKPDLRYPGSRIQSLEMAVPYMFKQSSRQVEGFRFNVDNYNKSYNMDTAIELLEEFKRENPSQDNNKYVAYIVGQGNEAKAYEEGGIDLWYNTDLDKINRHLWAQRPGTIVVIKERTGWFLGGNTKLGLLRTVLVNKAIEKQILCLPTDPVFAWVIDFPLFSPNSTTEPGQPGAAPFSSTHHPFTAPIPEDIHMLTSMPGRVRAEHYDLVVNGVELGGGSRRIHDAALQKYVLERVLKMHDEKLHQFNHLLEVLDSGCPPHAGIALGFDRLISVLMGVDGIRDVIAFPKSGKGADLMVGSPSVVPDKELRIYGLKRG